LGVHSPQAAFFDKSLENRVEAAGKPSKKSKEKLLNNKAGRKIPKNISKAEKQKNNFE